MVDERRLQSPRLEARLERADAERLGGVVTGEGDVNPGLPGLVVRLLFALAGDQGVRTDIDGLVEPADAAAGDDGDITDFLGTEVEGLDVPAAGVEGRLQAVAEVVDGQRLGRTAALADVLAAEFAERFAVVEVEQIGDAGSVTQFLVTVQRGVGSSASPAASTSGSPR